MFWRQIKGRFWRTTIFIVISKSQAHSRRHDPFAGQLRIRVQGVQLVIHSSGVKQPYRDVPDVAPESVAQPEIDLPELVAGQIGGDRLAADAVGLEKIALQIPVRLCTGEDAGSMVEQSVEAEQVQVGGLIPV